MESSPVKQAGLAVFSYLAAAAAPGDADALRPVLDAAEAYAAGFEPGALGEWAAPATARLLPVLMDGRWQPGLAAAAVDGGAAHATASSSSTPDHGPEGALSDHPSQRWQAAPPPSSSAAAAAAAVSWWQVDLPRPVTLECLQLTWRSTPTERGMPASLALLSRPGDDGEWAPVGPGELRAGVPGGVAHTHTVWLRGARLQQLRLVCTGFAAPAAGGAGGRPPTASSELGAGTAAHSLEHVAAFAVDPVTPAVTPRRTLQDILRLGELGAVHGAQPATVAAALRCLLSVARATAAPQALLTAAAALLALQPPPPPPPPPPPSEREQPLPGWLAALPRHAAALRLPLLEGLEGGQRPPAPPAGPGLLSRTRSASSMQGATTPPASPSASMASAGLPWAASAPPPAALDVPGVMRRLASATDEELESVLATTATTPPPLLPRWDPDCKSGNFDLSDAPGEGDAGGHVATTSTSTKGHVYGAVGFNRGRAAWELVCERDVARDECLCFGAGVKPVESSAYESAPNLYMVRGYNGRVYAAGEPTRTIGKIHPGDVVRFELDCAAGEVTCSINGASQGVVFTGLAGKTVFPAAAGYAESRAVRFRRLEAWGQTPGTAAAGEVPVSALADLAIGRTGFAVVPAAAKTAAAMTAAATAAVAAAALIAARAAFDGSGVAGPPVEEATSRARTQSPSAAGGSAISPAPRQASRGSSTPSGGGGAAQPPVAVVSDGHYVGGGYLEAQPPPASGGAAAGSTGSPSHARRRAYPVITVGGVPRPAGLSLRPDAFTGAPARVTFPLSLPLPAAASGTAAGGGGSGGGGGATTPRDDAYLRAVRLRPFEWFVGTVGVDDSSQPVPFSDDSDVTAAPAASSSETAPDSGGVEPPSSPSLSATAPPPPPARTRVLPVIMSVLADGKEVWTSPPLLRRGETAFARCYVGGASSLTLRARFADAQLAHAMAAAPAGTTQRPPATPVDVTSGTHEEASTSGAGLGAAAAGYTFASSPASRPGSAHTPSSALHATGRLVGVAAPKTVWMSASVLQARDWSWARRKHGFPPVFLDRPPEAAASEHVATSGGAGGAAPPPPQPRSLASPSLAAQPALARAAGQPSTPPQEHRSPSAGAASMRRSRSIERLTLPAPSLTTLPTAAGGHVVGPPRRGGTPTAAGMPGVDAGGGSGAGAGSSSTGGIAANVNAHVSAGIVCATTPLSLARFILGRVAFLARAHTAITQRGERAAQRLSRALAIPLPGGGGALGRDGAAHDVGGASGVSAGGGVSVLEPLLAAARLRCATPTKAEAAAGGAGADRLDAAAIASLLCDVGEVEAGVRLHAAWVMDVSGSCLRLLQRVLETALPHAWREAAAAQREAAAAQREAISRGVEAGGPTGGGGKPASTTLAPHPTTPTLAATPVFAARDGGPAAPPAAQPWVAPQPAAPRLSAQPRWARADSVGAASESSTPATPAASASACGIDADGSSQAQLLPAGFLAPPPALPHVGPPAAAQDSGTGVDWSTAGPPLVYDEEAVADARQPWCAVALAALVILRSHLRRLTASGVPPEAVGLGGAGAIARAPQCDSGGKPAGEATAAVAAAEELRQRRGAELAVDGDNVSNVAAPPASDDQARPLMPPTADAAPGTSVLASLHALLQGIADSGGGGGAGGGGGGGGGGRGAGGGFPAFLQTAAGDAVDAGLLLFYPTPTSRRALLRGLLAHGGTLELQVRVPAYAPPDAGVAAATTAPTGATAGGTAPASKGASRGGGKAGEAGAAAAADAAAVTVSGSEGVRDLRFDRMLLLAQLEAQRLRWSCELVTGLDLCSKPTGTRQGTMAHLLIDIPSQEQLASLRQRRKQRLRLHRQPRHAPSSHAGHHHRHSAGAAAGDDGDDHSGDDDAVAFLDAGLARVFQRAGMGAWSVPGGCVEPRIPLKIERLPDWESADRSARGAGGGGGGGGAVVRLYPRTYGMHFIQLVHQVEFGGGR